MEKNKEKIKEKKVMIKESEIIDFSLLEQILISGIKNCICKIIREIRFKHKLKSGTGCFCNIPSKNIRALITNNHILNKNFLDKEKKLIYYNYNNEKKEINLELNRYKYTDNILDFTIIEILPEDNISNFLEIDENIDLKNYKDEQIFSIQFPKNNLQYSHGKILGKNNNFLLYSIGALEGSSGSPLLLIENRKLIGLHKGAYSINKNNRVSLGIPINLLINKIDYIKCIYNINKEDVGKEIQLINNKYYNYDMKKLISNDELETKVKIMINGEQKTNILKYKFDKEGKYKIYIYLDNSELSISGMFYECICLEKIDLSSFKADNIINMSGLFSKCSSLKEINLTSFKSDYLRNVSWMFDGCSSLKEINLSDFKTNKINIMTGMFRGCSSLKEVNLLSFKTNRVKNMSSLFEECSSLREINLSSFRTDKLTNMSKMFNGCSSLKVINLYYFEIDKVTDMINVFDGIPIFSNLICNNNKLMEEFNNRKDKCILF